MRRCWAALLSLWLFWAAGCSPQSAPLLGVEFFDVGKADAMLITTPQGRRVLIDTATDKEGEALAEAMQEAGVTCIDLLIITHFDKDHVGGADHMLRTFEVGTLVMPVYDKESKQYTQLLEALEAHPPQEVVRMEPGTQAAPGLEAGVSLTITSAHELDYGEDEENDFSLAVRLTYGETAFFFTGDAENARQLELLDEGGVACDVLKVPHHGRYHDSSEAFLTACAPQIAFIPDSDSDPADERVTAILESLGAQVFCARDGGLLVVSDGTRVRVQR